MSHFRNKYVLQNISQIKLYCYCEQNTNLLFIFCVWIVLISLTMKFGFNGPSAQPSYVTYRSFRNFNEQLFYRELQTLNLDLLYELVEVDDKVLFLTATLLSVNAYQRHAPFITHNAVFPVIRKRG